MSVGSYNFQCIKCKAYTSGRNEHMDNCPECGSTAGYCSKAGFAINIADVGAGNKYKRTVPTTEIDIYDVIVAWDIRCPARQHALKKIMCAGERGAKGVVQDLDEAIQALQRAKELVG